MRYSTLFAVVFAGFCLMGGLGYLHSQKRQCEVDKTLQIRGQFQSIVGLPNLAITSAARYLRHYSITDLTTPFQDYPTSLDHFPAGFVFTPPDYSNMVSSIGIKKLESNQEK